MKKYLIFTLIVSLLLTLVACGGTGEAAAETPESTATASEAAVAEAAPETVPETAESAVEGSVMAEESYTVDMLYYLDLGNDTMMAACYTEEGVEMMGNDYYVVHVGEAEIYNAVGEAVSLEDLTRGCPVRIEWPGMVMESYPAQIAAVKVTALSDEADPSVPPADEIPAVDGGVKWWEPELVTELPAMTVEYSTPDYAVAVFLEGIGSWSYTEDGETWENTISSGDHPLDWTYDDNNTIKRVGFDTVKLVNSPAADTMVASAYVDGSDEAVDVAVEEDGTITLVDGDEVIYVVSCFWSSEDYEGDATYAFKVVVPQES